MSEPSDWPKTLETDRGVSGPIGAALRADADAARAEIRAAGISCPSCGVNMAGLPRDHILTMSAARSHEAGPGGAVVLARQPQVAKCEEGQPVELLDASGAVAVDYETYKAAMNINLYDTFRKAEDEAFRKMGFPV